MSRKRAFQEIEIKLPVPSLSAIRGTLGRLRARQIRPRTHESNTLYDTPDQKLRRRGRLIRIRTEQIKTKVRSKAGSQGPAAVLTYKAPARTHLGGRRAAAGKDARFKINEEAEVRIDRADQIDRILRGLGLCPAFRYEKYRTTYLLPEHKDVKIELDETPVGNYLELEGSPKGIDRAATLLGYAPADYLRETYSALYLADCKRRGLKPGHMLFLKTKKWR